MSESVVIIGVNDVKYPDGQSLHEVAIWNELGTETSPPRAAFRMGTEKAINSRQKQIQSYLLNTVISGLQKNKRLNSNGNRGRENILLTGIGQSAVKEIKEIIKEGSTVPNAPATVKKKGFDHPLRETGLLENNIAYKVK